MIQCGLRILNISMGWFKQNPHEPTSNKPSEWLKTTLETLALAGYTNLHACIYTRNDSDHWSYHHQMGVSKNRGTPKWMVKIMGKPY